MCVRADIHLRVILAAEIKLLDVLRGDGSGKAKAMGTADHGVPGNKNNVSASELLPCGIPFRMQRLHGLGITQGTVLLSGFHAACIGPGEKGCIFSRARRLRHGLMRVSQLTCIMPTCKSAGASDCHHAAAPARSYNSLPWTWNRSSQN